MPYLVNHHGTFWFQIRVPKTLVSRYGNHIRQNLSLTDRSLAQPLAYQLASHWLTQFACDRMTVKDQGPSSPSLQFPRLPMEAFTPEPSPEPPPYTEPSTVHVHLTYQARSIQPIQAFDTGESVRAVHVYETGSSSYLELHY